MISAIRRWFKGSDETVETSELIVRIEALERGFKGIRDEWEEHYERSHRLLGRMNARLRASKTDDLPEEEGEPAPPRRPSLHELRGRFMSRRGG